MARRYCGKLTIELFGFEKDESKYSGRVSISVGRVRGPTIVSWAFKDVRFAASHREDKAEQYDLAAAFVVGKALSAPVSDVCPKCYTWAHADGTCAKCGRPCERCNGTGWVSDPPKSFADMCRANMQADANGNPVIRRHKRRDTKGGG